MKINPLLLLFSFLFVNNFFSQGNYELQYVERLDLNCKKICSGYLRFDPSSPEIPMKEGEIPKDKYIKEGDWEYYNDGLLCIKEHYDNGLLNGIVEIHDEHGERKLNYQKGQLVNPTEKDIGSENRSKKYRSDLLSGRPMRPTKVKSENESIHPFKFEENCYINWIGRTLTDKEKYSDGINIKKSNTSEIEFNLKSGKLDGKFSGYVYQANGEKKEELVAFFKDGIPTGKWEFSECPGTSSLFFTIDFMDSEKEMIFTAKNKKDSIIHILNNCTINIASEDFFENCMMKSTQVYRNGQMITYDNYISNTKTVYYDNGAVELSIDLNTRNWVFYDVFGKQIKNGCSYENLGDLMKNCNPSDTRFASGKRGLE